MSIFHVIALFGGLALFLYGMRIMGDGLKHGSSGALKKAMGKVTNSPIVGFLLGLCVTAVIQSSSATIGILQALSVTGQLTFGSVYPILVGIYLGDCVTTAIVCSIGAKADAKRTGMVHHLFNLSEARAGLRGGQHPAQRRGAGPHLGRADHLRRHREHAYAVQSGLRGAPAAALRPVRKGLSRIGRP